MRAIISLCTVLFLTLTGAAFSNEDSSGARLLSLMGVDVSVETLRQQMQETPQAGGGYIDQVAKDWSEVAKQVFQTKQILSPGANFLDQNLTAGEFSQAEAYYTRGLGLKMTELENAAQGPEKDKIIQELGPKLIAELVVNNPERLSQIEYMMDMMGVVEMGTMVAMNFAFAVNSAMISSSENPNAISDEELLAVISGQYDAISVRLREIVIYTSIYTYQDVSNEELAQYIKFLESDLGKKLYNSIQLVYIKGLTQAANKFGRELMRRARTRQL